MGAFFKCKTTQVKQNLVVDKEIILKNALKQLPIHLITLFPEAVTKLKVLRKWKRSEKC